MSQGWGQQPGRRAPAAGLDLTVGKWRPGGVGVGHGPVDLTVGNIQTGARLGILLDFVKDHVKRNLVVLILSYHCHHSLR